MNKQWVAIKNKERDEKLCELYQNIRNTLIDSNIFQLFGKRQIDLNDEERKVYQRERKRNSRKRIAALREDK